MHSARRIQPEQRAEAAGDAVMPAYTHVRRAQPVLAAHFLLGHAAGFRRDYDHFDFAIRCADCLPLGFWIQVPFIFRSPHRILHR